jgi:hypothetical protein
MEIPEDVKAAFSGPEAALDETRQHQSKEVTKRLVEIFGDADQTSIKMQGSKFHSDTGKFSGVTNVDAREKLRSAGMLVE